VCGFDEDGERSSVRPFCDDERSSARGFCDDGDRSYGRPLYGVEPYCVRPFFGGERFYARRLFGEARFSVRASSPGSTHFRSLRMFFVWTLLWSLLLASAWYAGAVLPSLLSSRLS